MSEELTAIQVELEALNQQMVGVSEHRSRLMVLLTERSREIADLSSDLARAKTESLRHLEDAKSATRQLKRANERLAELTSAKQAVSAELSQLHDEFDTLRWELSSVKDARHTADAGLVTTSTELLKLRQELDAVRRTLEAKNCAWDQEREQLKMTLGGLSLEIQNEHQAARVLERRWMLMGPKVTPDTLSSEGGKGATRELLPVDYRLVRANALEEELNILREERGTLSARLRELERDAGATIELERLQQELRNQQVERQLLERKLEDANGRDDEREALRRSLAELQQQTHETDGLKAEIERLRAKLYKAPLNSGTFPVGPRLENLGQENAPPRDLGSELAEFAHHFDARSTVVADGLGFPVAATGTSGESDGLAAVAGEADRLSTQARQILGLSEVTQLTLEDRHGTIAHFRYFAVEDSIMSIVTLGTQVPDQESLDRIVGLTRRTLTEPRVRNATVPMRPNNRSSNQVPRHSGLRAVDSPIAQRKVDSR